MTQLPDILSFPKNFTFGTAVSAFQVEGNSGQRKSDWDEFLQKNPHIVAPEEIGPQWWEKGNAEKDIDMIASLGVQTQRLSFEWARIEPEEGEFNKSAIQRYREIIDYLKEKKITPLVTLNHYTLPLWVAQKGSWENQDIVRAFENYVTFVADKFTDVKMWLTLNEPGVLVECGYLRPFLPPQKKGFSAALRAHKNMLRAHRVAYYALKKYIPDSMVSMAFSFRWYRPANPKDILEKTYANSINYFDSLNYVDAVKDTIDFIGCNYYAGYYLHFNPAKIRFRLHGPEARPAKTILFGEVRKAGAYVSDLGAPIVPGFFLELLKTLGKRFKKPIIITENGIADYRDIHRPFYLLTHLVSVYRAIQLGVDIRGYIVWSTVDNLEWLDGYGKEFGLIHLNSVTGERKLRKSALLYKDIISANGIDIEKLLSTYFEGEERVRARELIHHLFLRHGADVLESIEREQIDNLI
jgi:beta-glucosidase